MSFLQIKPIFLLDNTLIFVLRWALRSSSLCRPLIRIRSTRQSTDQKQTGAFRTQTSALRLLRLARRPNQLQLTLRLPSQLLKDGTSLGTKISLHRMRKLHLWFELPPRSIAALLYTNPGNMWPLLITIMEPKLLQIGSSDLFLKRREQRMLYYSSVSGLTCPVPHSDYPFR